MAIAGDSQPEKINLLTTGIKRLTYYDKFKPACSHNKFTHDLRYRLKARHNKYTIQIMIQKKNLSLKCFMLSLFSLNNEHS